MIFYTVFGRPLIIYLSLILLSYVFRKTLFIRRIAISLNIWFFLYFLKLLIPNLVITNIFPALTDFFRRYQVLLLIQAFFIFFSALIFLKLIDYFLLEIYLRRKKSIRIPILFRDLVRFLLMIFVILIILNVNFGIKPTALITTSAVLSAIVGFALQDTLSNIFAGIAIHTEKPFSVGDWIEIGELEGEVTAMNWRATRIRTRDGNNIITPNNSVAKDRIVNFSTPTKDHAISTIIGFPYSAPPSMLKEIVLKSVSGHNSVLKNPPPQLRLFEFSDYAIKYQLRFWINDREHYLDILNDTQSRIWYALKRNDIIIPFPIRTVLMHDAEKEEKQIKIEQDKETYDILRNLDLFSPLNDTEIKKLLLFGARKIYQNGEIIIKENDPGDSFFLIELGIVSVWVEDENSGSSVKIRILEKGDFFGEMSLLTGEKRQATIKAESDIIAFEIKKDPFSDIIMKDPMIIEKLTHILTERQLKNKDILKAYAKQSLAETRKEISKGIIKKIKNFFNIKLERKHEN